MGEIVKISKDQGWLGFHCKGSKVQELDW
jgi:hypothetical protein